MYLVVQNHMGRGDDTLLGLRVARNRNGRRALTTQESHGFSHVECQGRKDVTGWLSPWMKVNGFQSLLKPVCDRIPVRLLKQRQRCVKGFLSLERGFCPQTTLGS
jgi:hypothetical protein